MHKKDKHIVKEKMSSSQELDEVPWSQNPGLTFLDDSSPISSLEVKRGSSFQKMDGYQTPPNRSLFSAFNSLPSSHFTSLMGSFESSPQKPKKNKRKYEEFSNAVNYEEVFDRLLGLQDPVIDKNQKTILEYFKRVEVPLVAKVTEKVKKKAKGKSPTTVQELTEDVMLGNTTLENIQKNYTSDGTLIMSDEESSEDDASDTELPEDTKQTPDVDNSTEQETEDLESLVQKGKGSNDEDSASESDQSGESANEEAEENQNAEKRTTKRYKLQNNVKKTRVGRAKNVNGKVRYFCTHCTNSYPLSKNLIWHLWGKKGHRCLEAGNEGYRWIKPTKCVEAQEQFMAENGWTFECMDSVQLVPDDFDPKPYHCPVEGCRMKFHEKRGLKKHIEKTCDEGHEAARVLGHSAC